MTYRCVDSVNQFDHGEKHGMRETVEGSRKVSHCRFIKRLNGADKTCSLFYAASMVPVRLVYLSSEDPLYKFCEILEALR